jgi:hypothetical protein
MPNQTSPHRIQFSTAQGFPEVVLIEWAGEETILPKMSRQVSLDLLPAREIVMQPANPFRQ